MPSKNDIIDEIEASAVKVTQCAVCTWLKDQPSVEQGKWDEAMKRTTLTHAAILRVLRNRGMVGGSNHAVSIHRAKHV